MWFNLLNEIIPTFILRFCAIIFRRDDRYRSDEVAVKAAMPTPIEQVISDVFKTVVGERVLSYVTLTVASEVAKPLIFGYRGGIKILLSVTPSKPIREQAIRV